MLFRSPTKIRGRVISPKEVPPTRAFGLLKNTLSSMSFVSLTKKRKDETFIRCNPSKAFKLTKPTALCRDNEKMVTG